MIIDESRGTVLVALVFSVKPTRFTHLPVQSLPHLGAVILRHEGVTVVSQLESHHVRHALLLEVSHQSQQPSVRRLFMQSCLQCVQGEVKRPVVFFGLE